MSTPSPSERRVSDDDARGFLKDAHLVGPWAVDLASNLLAERAISGKRRQWITDLEALVNVPCIGVHDERVQAVGFVYDEQWGWMALCAQHLSAVDATAHRVVPCSVPGLTAP